MGACVGQVYIGGERESQALLQDEPDTPRDSNWLLAPGGEVEEVCGSDRQAIHFAGKLYSISAHVKINSYMCLFLTCKSC